MKKALVLLTALLSFNVSASNQTELRYGFDWDCQKPNKEIAQLIIQCVQAGNPMSDEEPEDLVAQCASSIKDVMCKYSVVQRGYLNGQISTYRVLTDEEMAANEAKIKRILNK